MWHLNRRISEKDESLDKIIHFSWSARKAVVIIPLEHQNYKEKEDQNSPHSPTRHLDQEDCCDLPKMLEGLQVVEY
jgi:hypothetical protein